MEEDGIKYVKAEDFEVINQRKRYVHPQPFTDKEIRDAFFTFDMSGNGFVSAAEIRFVLDALGENVTDEEIDEMVRLLDADGDGQVNFKEFFKMASGDSLAPLGSALPPPKDMKELKNMNQTMQKSTKNINDSSYYTNRGSAFKKSGTKTPYGKQGTKTTPKSGTTKGYRDDPMGLKDEAFGSAQTGVKNLMDGLQKAD